MQILLIKQYPVSEILKLIEGEAGNQLNFLVIDLQIESLFLIQLASHSSI